VRPEIAIGVGRVTRKPIATLRRAVSELKRQVAELKRLLRAVQKGGQPRAATAASPESEAVNPSRIRPTGPMVRKLRAKQGLMQAEFAKLAGISGLTVYMWEKSAGRINPRGRALAGLSRVMGMGKREAKKALGGGE
jgi:DNA-binding transcriptional regulator YiaG